MDKKKNVVKVSNDKSLQKRKLLPSEMKQITNQLIVGAPGMQNEITERANWNIRYTFEHLMKDVEVVEGAIPEFIDKIVQMFRSSLVPDGEMVGLIAESAVGEPAYQLCLTPGSFTRLILRKGKKTEYFSGEIGPWVDKQMKKYENDLEIKGTSSVLRTDKMDCDIYTLSVNPKTDKMEWNKLSELSRHMANGGMVRTKTRMGRETITTLSHSHLKKDDEIIPIRGDQLQLGNRIPVYKRTYLQKERKSVKFEDMIIQLDFDMGWYVGAYLAEGSLSGSRITITNINQQFIDRCQTIADRFDVKLSTRDKSSMIYGHGPYHAKDNYFKHKTLARWLKKFFKIGSYNKQVSTLVWTTNKEFIRGLLRGYFDGDGNVNPSFKMVRTHSVSKQLCQGIASLLTIFGIASNTYIEKRKVKTQPDGKTPKSDCWCCAIHPKDIKIFLEEIGSDFDHKIKSMQEIISNIAGKTDQLDCIPGKVLELIGKVTYPFGFEGHSRTFKRWIKKPYIGRDVLLKYIEQIDQARIEKPNVKLYEGWQQDYDRLVVAANGDVIWDEIVELEILPDPKEFVYDFGIDGNHTFAVDEGIVVHNTLNSLDWNEKIVLTAGRDVNIIPIGKWIDDLLDNNNDKIVNLPENRTEYLELSEEVYIPSLDFDGECKWRLITAVTRHLPVGDLVKITTESGRNVTATQSKSFLTWNGEKLVHTPGSEIKVGDLVPVAFNIAEDFTSLDEYENIDLSNRLGFIIGLFLRCGFIGGNMIGFINLNSRDEIILKDWAKSKNIQCLDSGILRNENSSVLIIKSTRWSSLIDNWCKNGELPSFALIANKDFISGILDGFMNLLLKNNNLGLAMAELQMRFGIYSNFSLDYECYPRLFRDVCLERIDSIEFVQSSHEHVYDLTVPETTNFNVFGGLGMADTFHGAGLASKDVTLGIPRFNELLNATSSKKQKTPLTTVIFKDDQYKNLCEKIERSKDDQEELSNAKTEMLDFIESKRVEFEETTVNTFLISCTMKYLPDDVPGFSPMGLMNFEIYKEEWWVELSRKLYKERFENAIQPNKWVALLQFDKEKLYKYRTTLEDVVEKIEEEGNGRFSCVASPDNIGRIEVYFDFDSTLEYIKEKYASIEISSDESDEKRVLIDETNIDFFFTRDVIIENYIKNTFIGGISSIKKITAREDSLLGQIVMDVSGLGYKEILSRPDVDAYNTLINDMWSIFEVLGIESARDFIINELNTIISFDGTYINTRHIEVLADAMTYSGTITSVNRYGINDAGPIAKALFEKTIDNLTESASSTDSDHLGGLISAVVFGKIGNFGTGRVELLNKEQEYIPPAQRRLAKR